MEISINDYGKYLGIKGKNFVVFQNGEPSQEISFHNVKRAVISSGNNVSSSAIFWLATYGVETVITSKTGKLVSVLVPYYTDNRVDTRLKQYEAYYNHKGVEIAKAFVKARIQSQIALMEKYGLGASKLEKWLPKLDIDGDRVNDVRNRLIAFEAKCTRQYMKQYLIQFPKYLQPQKRYKYRARDPLNNLLNLGFEVIKREILLAIIPAHLDPFLGYLHSVQKYKPSLVYDMMEPFRALIEDFLLAYYTELGKDSFEKHGDRMFLKKDEEIEMIKAINGLLDQKVPYVRRNYTRTTKIRTVIREEP